MSEDFKRLQAKWYKKLKQTGFEDIEDTNSPNEMLKSWDSLYFLSRYDGNAFLAKQRYFELARQFLHEHVFDSSREKSIWTEFSEGASIRQIARRRRVSIYKIRKIVKLLEEAMLAQPDTD